MGGFLASGHYRQHTQIDPITHTHIVHTHTHTHSHIQRQKITGTSLSIILRLDENSRGRKGWPSVGPAQCIPPLLPGLSRFSISSTGRAGSAHTQNYMLISNQRCIYGSFSGRTVEGGGGGGGERRGRFSPVRVLEINMLLDLDLGQTRRLSDVENLLKECFRAEYLCSLLAGCLNESKDCLGKKFA